ncbi:hypothetical protein BZA05DRAFT_444007 [Tricharina praecox]|uniref:uncharacterized protein n=1 Tax=Tricharina praecox TaxID=43433 RepID=UPI00221F1D86|nr:uncharacterized protein BZA05DRAFT_444007 [Tricharina praecox]KAI5853716.1 hypothetical protein BZA05DRAFT_444007 [Tricharina praecox]
MPGFRESLRSFFSRSFCRRKHRQARRDKLGPSSPSLSPQTTTTSSRTRTRTPTLSTQPTATATNAPSRDHCLHCECEFESGYGAPFRPCEHTGMHYRCARLLFRFQQKVSCPTCGATLDLTTEVDDSWRSRKSVDSRMAGDIVGGEGYGGVARVERPTTMNKSTTIT